MTRKDYELIAKALKLARDNLTQGQDSTALVCVGICNVNAIRVADALANENPRFDRERFLEACGIQS